MNSATARYNNYITKLAHEMECGITGDALSTMNNLTNFCLSSMVRIANSLLITKNNRKTMSAETFQSATRIFLPVSLAESAQKAGLKAVMKFDAKKETDHPVSRSEASGLIFPVPRTENVIDLLRISERKTGNAAIYVTGILQEIIKQLLEKSNEQAKLTNKVRITPRHIKLAIVEDPDFSVVFRKVVIGGGVPLRVPSKVSTSAPKVKKTTPKKSKAQAKVKKSTKGKKNK